MNTQRPELPPGYEVRCFETNALPYAAMRLQEIILLEIRPNSGFFAERSEAVAACWAHWREHGPKQWVEYLDRGSSAVPAIAALADRREVVLSLLPSDAVFLTDYATGSLHGPACEGYVGNEWSAGVFDPRSEQVRPYLEAKVKTEESGGRRALSPDQPHSFTVPVAERLTEPKPGTVVAALVDEVVRLRAALARREGGK